MISTVRTTDASAERLGLCTVDVGERWQSRGVSLSDLPSLDSLAALREATSIDYLALSRLAITNPRIASNPSLVRLDLGGLETVDDLGVYDNQSLDAGGVTLQPELATQFGFRAKLSQLARVIEATAR